MLFPYTENNLLHCYRISVLNSHTYWFIVFEELKMSNLHMFIHYHIMTVISMLISETAFRNSFQVKKES